MVAVLKSSGNRSFIVLCRFKDDFKKNYLAKRLTIKCSKKCARNFELFMIVLCYSL